MKTATVRDLRNHYTTLLSWISAGEEVVITQRGKAIARLIPERAEDEDAAIDWSKSAAFARRQQPSGQTLTAEEALNLIHESSGKW